MISKHLKNALESGMKESKEEDGAEPKDPPAPSDGMTDVGIHLEINAEILEICIKFMHYKHINS